MSMILDNDILARFTQTNVIVGLSLLVVGVLLAIFSGLITRLIRKQPKVKSTDKIFLSIKAIALAIILASLIVMIIE